MRRMPETARPLFVSAVGGRRLMCHQPRSDGPELTGRKLLSAAWPKFVSGHAWHPHWHQRSPAAWWGFQ